jgi:Domain of unknown function (DUF4388)
MEGDLSLLSIPDLLQMICLGGYSRDIHLFEGQTQIGVIAIRNGRVDRCFGYGTWGEAAFFKLVNMRRGRYKVNEAQDMSASDATLTAYSWQELLMEAARQQDEALRAAQVAEASSGRVIPFPTPHAAGATTLDASGATGAAMLRDSSSGSSLDFDFSPMFDSGLSSIPGGTPGSGVFPISGLSSTSPSSPAPAPLSPSPVAPPLANVPASPVSASPAATPRAKSDTGRHTLPIPPATPRAKSDTGRHTLPIPETPRAHSDTGRHSPFTAAPRAKTDTGPLHPRAKTDTGQNVPVAVATLIGSAPAAAPPPAAPPPPVASAPPAVEPPVTAAPTAAPAPPVASAPPAPADVASSGGADSAAEDVMHLLQEATACYLRRDLARAEALLQKCLELRPGDKRALQNLDRIRRKKPQ